MNASLHDSDAALVSRVRHGDCDAFSQLSRRHESKILAVSWRILKNREDAEDNAQSTMTTAYFKCGQFRGQSKFSTWLVRVAINEALIRLRTRRYHEELSLDSDSGTGDGFAAIDPACNANQERECIARDLVKKLCAHLPPKLRDPFVLYSMEGWSQEELSRAYGVPIETIKSRIFRARCRLQKQWARHTQRRRAGRKQCACIKPE